MVAAAPSALSPSLADRLKSRLEAALGPSKVLSAPDALERYSGDESGEEPALPDCVVLAESADDLAKALAIGHDLGAPMVPRGGGTGKSGGAIPSQGGCVLAMERMKRIVELDEDELVAVVEPGVVLADLHAAVEARGLFYPPDPNSWSTCTLGGNVAENAGGPRAYKYGCTRDWVLGLEALLPDGTPLRVGKRTPKGVTGYDVTSLLVGSEGTLAVTTRAILQLVPLPRGVATLLATFDDVDGAARGVTAVLRSGEVPRCVELFDDTSLGLVRARGVAIPEGAGAMLLVELDGDEVSIEQAAERVGGALEVVAREVLAATNAAERDRLWAARRAMSPASRASARWKTSEDVVVPRRQMGALVRESKAIAARWGIRTLSYGHAGDGNLHVNFLWDDPDASRSVGKALAELFAETVRLGGTLTGEHGVGLTKRAFLGLEQSAELMQLEQRVKAAFDPRGVLNPGKIFPPRGHGAC